MTKLEYAKLVRALREARRTAASLTESPDSREIAELAIDLATLLLARSFSLGDLLNDVLPPAHN